MRAEWHFGKRGPVMTYIIRRSSPDDSEAISTVIVAALRQTNAKDYSEAIIHRLAESFAPEAMLALMSTRTVFVATLDGQIVGTASLDGTFVRTVFIAPKHQGQGIGRQLMEAVERAARNDGVSTLALQSSITAEPFYAKLGFRSVRDSHHGEERTIVMERRLSSSILSSTEGNEC